MTNQGGPNKKNSIPEFKTAQEEAEFWDTHSIADYWDELEPSDFRFSPNIRHVISVPLKPDTIQQLYHLSVEEGVKFDDLAAGWIEERLHAETQKRKKAKREG